MIGKLIALGIGTKLINDKCKESPEFDRAVKTVVRRGSYVAGRAYNTSKRVGKDLKEGFMEGLKEGPLYKEGGPFYDNKNSNR